MNRVKHPAATFLLFKAIILILLSSCSKGNTVIEEGRFLKINIAEITETVKFYHVIVDGINMEVITVKAPDGTSRIAYNTCERCCGTGEGFFAQEENDLICQHCQMRIRIDSIGITSGGCQPVSIPEDEIQIKDDTIIISYNTLSADIQWFLSNDQLSGDQIPDDDQISGGDPE